MNKYESQLWQKIEAFRIDKPNAIFTFADKLAKENNLSISFTHRLILEYKKFIFLCAVLPNDVSPSKLVDITWHLHLTYTKSYWDDLCSDLLNKKIHHSPSQGNSKETKELSKSFEYTLEMYKHYFGQNPPDDIWNNLKRKEKIQLKSIDTSIYWIFKKPNFQFSSTAFQSLFIISFSLFFLGCSSPQDYIIIAIGIFLFIFGAINSSSRNRTNMGGRNSFDSSSSSCSTSSDSGHYYSNDENHDEDNKGSKDNDSKDNDNSLDSNDNNNDSSDSSDSGSSCSSCSSSD